MYKDWLGNELKVGDEVICIRLSKSGTSVLRSGIIMEFKTIFGKLKAKVNTEYVDLEKCLLKTNI